MEMVMEMEMGQAIMDTTKIVMETAIKIIIIIDKKLIHRKIVKIKNLHSIKMICMTLT